MKWYHGSPVGGLTELKPFLSEHGKPYLYFAQDPLVALLYAVKPVPKPLSFYPYGFAGDGKVVYSEYFENAFWKLYSGQTGYLYTCSDFVGSENPTKIPGVCTSTAPVMAEKCTEIPDLYQYYKEQEKRGLFYLRPYDTIPEKERNYVLEGWKKDIQDYHLKKTPNHASSIFIKTYFPAAWEMAD